MIQNIELHNFGPLTSVKWYNLSNINLVIGKNGSGKTFILKALYTAMRTLEAYRRGDDKRELKEILYDKLYWTFQLDRIGDLVTKNASGKLRLKLHFDDNRFSYSFGRDTVKQIESIESHVKERNENSIFLPAKEVLSLFHIILKSREQDQAFGFDDTYLDLVRALRINTKKGNFYQQITQAREALSAILDGSVSFDEKLNRWIFRDKQQYKFPIGAAAEGIKKISILDTLLGNRYLTHDSIVFIDEPESALHPQAISKFMEIIFILSQAGMQFFMATHSYFVIKKLYLIAIEEKCPINVLSIADNEKVNNEKINTYNLQDGLPENPIIEESIRLYEKETDLAFRQ